MDIADLERKLGIDGISAEQQMEIITALQQSAAEKIAKAKSESIGKGAEGRGGCARSPNSLTCLLNKYNLITFGTLLPLLL